MPYLPIAENTPTTTKRASQDKTPSRALWMKEPSSPEKDIPQKNTIP